MINWVVILIILVIFLGIVYIYFNDKIYAAVDVLRNILKVKP